MSGSRSARRSTRAARCAASRSMALVALSPPRTGSRDWRSASVAAVRASSARRRNGSTDAAAEARAAEACAAPVPQVDRAFLLAFGRPPSEPERSAAAAIVRDHGAPVLARALFNANEFLHVP